MISKGIIVFSTASLVLLSPLLFTIATIRVKAK